MIYLLLGMAIFLGVHSISIVARPWRTQMIGKLGEMPWKGIYSIVSLIGFVLIIIGYGAARLDPMVVYAPPAWLRHLAMLLLIPVFPLLVATYLPGRIKNAVKHPMLVATKLWALAHLLANGMLADLVLFGGFMAWAVADRISVKRRGTVPPVTPPTGWRNDLIVIIAGLGLYVWFVLWGHAWLIGVPPVAMR